MANGPGTSDAQFTQKSGGGFKIHKIEVVHPGYAYKWENGLGFGLYLESNLSPDDINRRDSKEGIVFFPSNERVWAWAKRVSNVTPSREGHDV